MTKNKLTGNEIIKTVMTETKTTQYDLSVKLGYRSQGTISSMVNSTRMSLDKFVLMLNAMGKHVCVVNDDMEIEYEVKQ